MSHKFQGIFIMIIYCTITIDVEVDKSPLYKVSDDFLFNNVTIGIDKVLDPLFSNYQVSPTYLISSEVLLDNKSVNILKNLKSHHELGTHGHAEFLEFKEKSSVLRGSKLSKFVNEDSYQIEYANLKWLTDLFIEKIGYRPRTFRGGRFGVGNSTLKILSELNYLVDTSVTPGLYHRGKKNVVDYLSFPEQPYIWKNNADLLKKHNNHIVELPVSCWQESNISKYIGKIGSSIKTGKFNIISKFVDRILGKLTKPICWIRPTYGNTEILNRLINLYQKRHGGLNSILINVMFHSFEVIPNASPYAKNNAEVQRIINNLIAIIDTLKNKNAQFLTTKEYLKVI